MFEKLFGSVFSKNKASSQNISLIIRLNSQNVSVPGSMNHIARENFIKAEGKVARYEFYYDVTHDQLLFYAIVNENLRDKLRANKMLWVIKKSKNEKLNSSGFQNDAVKISLEDLKKGVYVVLGEEKGKDLKVSDFIQFVSEA
ncbi:hypothetical protein HN681_01810 [archaeon]|mgnify:FL=1|jgi:hypothetical protein|nr:hypothetical protein [archaeon]MBT3464259.1 hypothetical protein [archaeon]MBT3730543.1 hypothetical protein [archaeon]MBT4669391.1 hypothetical protein [archaeon]MBT5029856.1 hypothetical protein [archaeon]